MTVSAQSKGKKKAILLVIVGILILAIALIVLLPSGHSTQYLPYELKPEMSYNDVYTTLSKHFEMWSKYDDASTNYYFGEGTYDSIPVSGGYLVFATGENVGYNCHLLVNDSNAYEPLLKKCNDKYGKPKTEDNERHLWQNENNGSFFSLHEPTKDDKETTFDIVFGVFREK